MFKDFIKQQTDMQWYPVISLVTFIVFFLALSIRAFMYNKQELNDMGSIPLGNDFVQIDNFKDIK